MGKRVTQLQIEEMVALFEGGMTQGEIAAKLDLSRLTVSKYIRSASPERHCVWCNDPFPVRRGQMYCDEDCRVKALAERNRDNPRTAARIEATRILVTRHADEFEAIIQSLMAP